MPNYSNKILRGAALLFLIAMTILLASCSDNGGKSEGLSAVMFPFAGGLSDQGFVQEIDGTLWYYDLKSGKSVAMLCRDKSNCKDNPYYKYDTDSYGIAASVMYKDSLYVFVREGLNETILYRMKPEVDGRDKVATIKWDVSSGNAIVYDGKAYFPGAQMIMDDDGSSNSSNQILSMIGVDLSTGKVTELGEQLHNDGGSALDSLYIVDGKLRYRYVYEQMTDEERALLEQGKMTPEQGRPLLKAKFYEVDLKTRASRLLLDGSDYSGIAMEGDGSYAYFMNEARTKVYRVGLTDRQKTDLFEARDLVDKVNGVVSGAGIFFWQELESGKKYFYSFKTGEVQEIHQENVSFPLVAFKKWVAVGKTINGQYQKVYIKLDDYLAGKDNYIAIK